MTLEPIGHFHCSKNNPYEAARQGSLDLEAQGYIELMAGNNFEQALEGLKEFSHLWIIFQFHLNLNWKPKVQPPRGTNQKIGVFATRSPHRPNPIGMSCVRLDKIEGLKIFVRSHDLIDETPIFDIKPYLKYADSFPEANLGWIKGDPLFVDWSPLATLQLNYLKSLGLTEVQGFIQNQLSEDPINSKKKRVWETETANQFVLAYRTWRIHFDLREKGPYILQFSSGYSANDLSDPEDKYSDKKIHLEFNQQTNWI